MNLNLNNAATVEPAGNFFAAKLRETVRSSKKLAKRIFAPAEDLNSHVRIPSSAVGLTPRV